MDAVAGLAAGRGQPLAPFAPLGGLAALPTVSEMGVRVHR